MINSDLKTVCFHNGIFVILFYFLLFFFGGKTTKISLYRIIFTIIVPYRTVQALKIILSGCWKESSASGSHRVPFVFAMLSSAITSFPRPWSRWCPRETWDRSWSWCSCSSSFWLSWQVLSTHSVGDWGGDEDSGWTPVAAHTASPSTWPTHHRLQRSWQPIATLQSVSALSTGAASYRYQITVRRRRRVRKVMAKILTIKCTTAPVRTSDQKPQSQYSAMRAIISEEASLIPLNCAYLFTQSC